MKKIIFLVLLPFLFLVSCNSKGDNTKTTTNPKSIESTESSKEVKESSKEITESSNENSSDKPSSSKEESKGSTTTKKGNVDNGGEYTENSTESWIYLG